MPPRILIADDNRSVRIVLHQLLGSAQAVEFLQAEDGDDAVRKALEFHPEIIILDFAMPVMDGLTAARKILQNLPHTPIFLYTMHWSKSLEHEAAAAGVREVISKDRSTDLIAAVQQLLRAKPPAAAVPDSSSPEKKSKMETCPDPPSS